MSRTLLVTVSDDRSGRKGGLYGATQEKMRRLFINNQHLGLEQLHITWEDIKTTPFYLEYKKMLDDPDPARNGRLYKPYVIRMALSLLEEGDYLIYNDCSPEMWLMEEVEYIDPEVYCLDIIRKLTGLNRNFLTAFVRWDDKFIPPGDFGKHIHHYFTLDSCIEIMKGEDYRYSFQCASGMISIRKTPETVSLVDNWFHYNRIKECACMNVDETEDSYYSGHPGYKLGNRHDQSVLSMILNQQNFDYVDIVYNDLSPYNFLNFCRRDQVYTFLNSNNPINL